MLTIVQHLLAYLRNRSERLKQKCERFQQSRKILEELVTSKEDPETVKKKLEQQLALLTSSSGKKNTFSEKPSLFRSLLNFIELKDPNEQSSSDKTEASTQNSKEYNNSNSEQNEKSNPKNDNPTFHNQNKVNEDHNPKTSDSKQIDEILTKLEVIEKYLSCLGRFKQSQNLSNLLKNLVEPKLKEEMEKAAKVTTTIENIKSKFATVTSAMKKTFKMYSS
jgi:hypothetical protein